MLQVQFILNAEIDSQHSGCIMLHQTETHALYHTNSSPTDLARVLQQLLQVSVYCSLQAEGRLRTDAKSPHCSSEEK